jgi:transitional endoplasmic reticulum ATPase
MSESNGEGMTALQECVQEHQEKQKKRGVTFKDVEVIESAETNRIILPEGMGAEEAQKWLKRYEEQMAMEVELNIEIEAFPLDGAIALAKVLKETFGWTNLIPTKSFFGDIPPRLIEVEVAPGIREQVHWGKMQIPGIAGYIETGITQKGKRVMFVIGGVIRRKHEKLIHGLAEKVRQRVKEHSIYRGKAIRISFRDEEGNPKSFSPDDGPTFIDTSAIKEDELIFPEETQVEIETTMFTPIEYADGCRDVRVPLKRGIMLEGPYGVGKTLAAYVTAKKCVRHGVTFLYCDDVRDLDAALALGDIIGGQVVVFSEDVDRAVGLERDSEVDRILNTLDGVNTKSSEVMTVLTTNNIHGINQAMIRPGRIDTVIPVRAPDSNAAARLVLLYGRGLVDSTERELEDALKPLMGCNAAVFREVVEKSKLAAVRRLKGNCKNLTVEACDIGIAAVSMQQHMDLLKPRVDTSDTPMEKFGRAVGRELGAELGPKEPEAN